LSAASTREGKGLEKFSLLGGPLHRLGRRPGLVRGETNMVALGLALGLLNFAGAQQVSSYAVYDIHGEKILANRAEKTLRADLGTHVAYWRVRNAPLRKNSGNAETQRSLKEPWCSDLVLSVIPLVTEANMDNTTLIILIVLVILLGGGGWYGRGRWF
jgi:hypothetical protein